MPPQRPGNVAFVAFFLLAATLIALATGISLVHPGMVLDRLWQLNPRAYVVFAPLGRLAGALLLLLACITATTGIGLLRRHRWAWLLAIAIFACSGLGDLISLLFRDRMKGAAGALIAGVFLFLLLRPRMRSFFSRSA